MSKVEKVLFWCGIGLCVALIAIVSTMGVVSWISGLVIPYVAIGGLFAGMRLKTWQYIKRSKEGGIG